MNHLSLLVLFSSIIQGDSVVELLAGPRLSWYEHNPVELVRVTNRLHAMGRDKTIAILEKYLRLRPSLEYYDEEGNRIPTTPDSSILHAVVCCLFIARDDVSRPTIASEEYSARQEMEVRATFPSYPVLLIEGLPIWVESAAWAVSLPDPNPDTDHHLVLAQQLGFLTWAKEHGEFRSAPLRLPANPITTVDSYFRDEGNRVAMRKLFGAQATIPSNEEDDRAKESLQSPDKLRADRMLFYLENSARHQAYNAVKPLLDEEVTKRLGFSPTGSSEFEDDTWRVVREVASDVELVWNTETESYHISREQAQKKH